MSIIKKTAVEIREHIKNKKISVKEVAKTFLDNAKQKDKELNAFISFTEESAYKKADEIDKKIANSEKLGILAGVPIVVKDNICVKGVKTTCGSKILENFISPYNAHVIEKLEEQDAVIIGKTNMDEFAMGSSTETSYFGPAKNPCNNECAPGGSSGGSAAAVASYGAPIALGSDTGGSIRQPASFCGVYGLKPTYGMVSRYGLVAFGSSLDQIGPFARSIDDIALLLDTISGYDQKDSTSLNIQTPVFYNQIDDLDVKNLKIGLPKEYFGQGLDSDVKKNVLASIDFLKSNGATIKDISLPHTDYAVAAYYIIAPSEASSNLARYDGVKYGYRADDINDLMEEYTITREKGFGDEVKRRIMIGTYSLSSGYYDAYYLKAQKVRALIANDFENAFKDVDIIVTPTSPTTAFKLGEKTDDPLTMYLSDIYTISANLAGIPGISMPCGLDNKNMPIGLQILAPCLKEGLILKTAKYLEKIKK